MPYKKYRRYTRKKKSYRYSKYKHKTIAYKAFKMGKKAMRYLNTEHKFFDTVLSIRPVDFNGFILPLTLIPQGDGDQSRDGDSLKLMSYTFRGYGTIGAVNATLRIIIFWDKQDQITNPVDILDTNYVGTNNAPNSPKSHDRRFRTKILHDKIYNLTNTGGNSRIKFKNYNKVLRRIQYNNGTTNALTGSLKMLYISDVSDVTPGDEPNVFVVHRVVFIDN